MIDLFGAEADFVTKIKVNGILDICSNSQVKLVSSSEWVIYLIAPRLLEY